MFKGAGDGGRINQQAMRLLLRALGLDYDGHRFRTTFKFALDNLKHVLDSSAVAVVHDYAIGGKVAETYRDTSLIGHRRILNERWPCFLRGVAYTGDFEVPALSVVVVDTPQRHSMPLPRTERAAIVRTPRQCCAVTTKLQLAPHRRHSYRGAFLCRSLCW